MAERNGRPALHRRLYVQVVAASLSGMALGLVFPEVAATLEPLADGFVKLVRLIVNPLVFCTLVLGIAGLSGAAAGRIGLKAILYFEVVSTIALLAGLGAGLLLAPGAGLDVDPARIDASALKAFVQPGAPSSIQAFLLNVIPDTMVSAFVGSSILQVLFVALIAGIGLSTLGERGAPLVAMLRHAEQWIFAITRLLLHFAPVGAFGAMAYVVGQFGFGAMERLGGLIATFYLTDAMFVLVVLGAICRACDIPLFRLVRLLKPDLLLVFGTSSAESALPTLIARLEAAGVAKRVVGVVVPGGYAFNCDGTYIYLTLAITFICQAMNIHLSLGQLAGVLAVAMLTSKGSGGVTGSAFIALVSTLTVVPDIPLAGAAIILGVDRVLSEVRSVTNVVGTAVATLAVARWEGALDTERLRAVLADPGLLDTSAADPAGERL